MLKFVVLTFSIAIQQFIVLTSFHYMCKKHFDNAFVSKHPMQYMFCVTFLCIVCLVSSYRIMSAMYLQVHFNDSIVFYFNNDKCFICNIVPVKPNFFSTHCFYMCVLTLFRLLSNCDFVFYHVLLVQCRLSILRNAFSSPKM